MSFDWLADLWCRIMHPAPMWPINGYYRCPACQRRYPVPWETAPQPAVTGAGVMVRGEA